MAGNSGLGRGLDSLIPKIDEIETEFEEGVSLEDLLESAEKDEESDDVKIAEDKKNAKNKKSTKNKKSGRNKKNAKNKKSKANEKKPKIEDVKKDGETSEYTNIFNNDDEKIADEISVENIESTISENEVAKESIQNIEASDKENEPSSFLSEKEEKLIDEVIKTVENNPRITLWSARSAAVLRFLRKTEPEFSISNEASNLIDEAIAEKYPEIWTLFNHL